MKSIVSKVNNHCCSECEKYRVRYLFAILIIFLPLITIPSYGLSMLLPQTRRVALLLVKENHVVEILTFVFLFLGSLQGLYLGWWAISKEKLFTGTFYALFSLGMFFVAMEEIAWGQQFFNFQTPYFIKTINAQRELTVHNLNGLHGKSEFFHILFGAGGLVGIWLNTRLSSHEIGVPLVLLTWFFSITAVSGIDLYNDYFPIEKSFDQGMRWMSEVIEMLIGIAGFLYISLMTRKLKIKWQ